MRIVRGLFSDYTGKGLGPAGYGPNAVPHGSGRIMSANTGSHGNRGPGIDRGYGAMELEFVIVIVIRKGRIDG